MVSIKRSKATRLHDVVPLEYEQVEELVKLHSARFRPIIWTGYFTGMRPSEILGLTIEQIDFEKKTSFELRSADNTVIVKMGVRWIYGE